MQLAQFLLAAICMLLVIGTLVAVVVISRLRAKERRRFRRRGYDGPRPWYAKL